MKIVVDTNVIISAIFYGREPRKVLESVSTQQVQAGATEEILQEYETIVTRLKERQQKRQQMCFDESLYNSFKERLVIVPSVSTTDICRDEKDNKFLACAKDVKAMLIVSGDNDLLVLGEFEGTLIVTVRQFLDDFLPLAKATPN